MSDTLLTGASKPVIFSDGSQLNLSPLSDKDITELDNWVKSRYLHTQISNIPENISDDLKDRMIILAQQTAGTLCWYLGLGASIMASIDGMTQIIYQSAKNNHPDITYDIIHEKLLSKDNYNKAEDTFAELNDVRDSKLKNPTIRGSRKTKKKKSVLKKKT